MPEPVPRRKYVCYCYTFLNLGDLLPCLLQSYLFYIYFAKHRKAAPFVLPDIIRPSALLISLTPKFAVSLCELHVSVFLEYQQCAFSFEVSHEPRNAHLGRDTDQHMYVVWAHLSFNYFYSFPLAELAKYFSYLQAFLGEKYFSPIFWRKYNMVLAIPTRMC